MNNIIQFPVRNSVAATRPRRNNVRGSFSLCDHKYLAFCAMRDEVAQIECVAYASRFEHADAWGVLVARGETERELERLRKIVNPTGRLRGT